ncbi:MAG: HD domain-containing protein [Phycisphaerales bacterium]|nr:HD domain-containing protein [Phycisphaerales bacterium]
MSNMAHTEEFDPAAGRLPTSQIEWPISADRFDALVKNWRLEGFWLSLWSGEDRCVAFDEHCGPFWKLFAHPDGRFMQKVVATARENFQSVNSDVRPSAEPCICGPWAPAVPLIVVPLIDRRRCVGAVIAACVSDKAPQEDFARFCGDCEIDETFARKQLDDSTCVESVRLRQRTDLLALTIRQARECERRHDEIAVLTNNLESTYEELHLIYEISNHMSIPQNPEKILEIVGNELLAVTRAAGVAFVLPWHDYEESPGGGEGETRRAGQWKHVVTIGEVGANSSDLIRMTDCLLPQLESGPKHLLLNKAPEQPGLAWTKPWLKHLVAYPMVQEGANLGICYTINCTDIGDYTSVDVQLFRAVVDRIASALHNQHLYDDLADLLMGMLHALVNSVDAKDPYTFGHSGRVAFFSRALAQSAGLPPIECERVYLSGLLHDIGKIGVPDAVLTKPGRLTREEFDLLKKHPEIGQRILSRVRQIQDLVPGVLYHHERIDGRGYPHGVAGKAIPLFGRIICIADSFDAMTSNRTYRAALPIPMAISEIRRCSGSQFDPFLAERFLAANPHAMFEAAIEGSRGECDIGRIGALFCNMNRGMSAPVAKISTEGPMSMESHA